MRALRHVGLLLLLSSAALAQNVRVEVDDVTDNRVAAGELRGMLEMRLKLAGANVDKAAAARVVVKEARDDRGNSLGTGSGPDDFVPREYNSGTLQVAVSSPARAASKVTLKGTVELYVPSRDPAALVTVDKALAKLDKPLDAKALKSAKLVITPLSRAAYARMREERKLDETKIAALRERGRKEGIPEKELEMMIGLAQAFDSIDTEPPEGTIILSGKKADFERIYRFDVLGPDGKALDVPSRQSSTRGDDVIVMLQPAQPPPANASLQVHLLTQKSRVFSPFELTVELP